MSQLRSIDGLVIYFSIVKRSAGYNSQEIKFDWQCSIPHHSHRQHLILIWPHLSQAANMEWMVFPGMSCFLANVKELRANGVHLSQSNLICYLLIVEDICFAFLSCFIFNLLWWMQRKYYWNIVSTWPRFFFFLTRRFAALPQYSQLYPAWFFCNLFILKSNIYLV